MRVHVLIPAAGRGVRFGTAENKIFALLAGRPVVAHTADVFLGCAAVDTVTLIGREGELERVAEAVSTGLPGGAAKYCVGGETRQESVAAGLEQLAREGSSASDLVLVHDAARPLATGDLVMRCIDEAAREGTAVAALPLSETIKRADVSMLKVEQTIPRERLWAAQTPQAASLQLLQRAAALAAAQGASATDESSLLEGAGVAPRLIPGERSNIKITTQDDLAFAETLIAARENSRRASGPAIRVGIGYDIHPLAVGRRCVLGGVEIAHPRGLLGHSDADVVLHAICDALLGAAGLPDIGHLFPNDDPGYAGADSVNLLRAVREAVGAEGYAIGNVDACVIAEEPKIAPHAPAMRRIIAETLDVGADAISIKATTNEKIGSLGAGEGIACHATALIIRTR